MFFILTWSNTELVPIYKDINLTNHSLIVSKLSSLGINYEINDGEILVNPDSVRKIRMLLAEEGLPSNGSIVGYEVFNKSEALGTSSFAQNVNLLRALEGELSRTIMSFDSIQNARVHLVIPKKELFSKKSNKPKASIVLKLHIGAKIGSKEISAITHLVASAVQGLKTEDITIVSTDGKPFKLPEYIQESAISSSIQEYKIETEKRLKLSIESLLSKFVGPDRIRAEVNLELDLEHLTVDSEIFDPDSQVVRSLQNTEEGGSSNENTDSVSVGNNIPNANSNNDNSGSASKTEKKEEITNYEISREIRKKKKEIGGIKRLSIAVLIDGNYSYDESTSKYLYAPHQPEVIEKLYLLAASAVGLNVDRGDVLEVINMQFSQDNQVTGDVTIEGNFEDKTYEIVKFAMIPLSILILFLIFLFLRRSAKKAKIDNNHPVVNETSMEEELSVLTK